jgi:carbon starvation protein
MGIGYLGLVVSHPVVKLPAFTGWKAGVGSLWPMLFVTVACGAVSGFHSLISSGTTSKQIATEKHARRIGYGAMVAEGLVATLALLAVASGFTGLSSLTKMVKAGQTIPAFGQGFSFVTRPILGEFGGLMAITILNAFILTTLDTATRIARYIAGELFGVGNRIVATVVPVVLAGALVWGGKAAKIWTIFGAANQLMAALALMVVTFWLLSQKKLVRYTLVPGIFMLVTTVGSLAYGVVKYFKTNDFLLAVISLVLIALSILMLAESIAALRRVKRAT